MTHVVVLCRSESGAGDKPILGTDKLASEECCEVWVGVGEVGYGEVAGEGCFGEVDILRCRQLLLCGHKRRFSA